ncbi:hypothetical protein V5799_005395, partial [Amblyomma americanum]
MVDALDQSVAAVLEALEAASMLENTIIVFSSDNGAIQRGDVRRLGPVDGIDMWKALNVGKPSPRTEILLNIDPAAGTAALRYQNFKLVAGIYTMSYQRFETPGNDRPYDDLNHLLRQSRAATVLRRLYGKKPVFKKLDRWRREATVTCPDSASSNFAFNVTYHLFDIAQDPCELHNLADEKPG